VSDAIFVTGYTECKNNGFNNKDLPMEPHENARFEVLIAVTMNITVFL
jgi:hypothetical protein